MTTEKVRQDILGLPEGTVIRFREEPKQRHYDFMSVARTADMMLSLARETDRPLYGQYQVKRRANMNAVPVIGTTFDQPAPSKHRSKRLWKKLRRKTAAPLYGEPVIMSFDAERLKRVMEKMK